MLVFGALGLVRRDPVPGRRKPPALRIFLLKAMWSRPQQSLFHEPRNPKDQPCAVLLLVWQLL